MRLTIYTDYSLRVMLMLAVAQNRLVTIKEIAERYDISRNHLVKVVRHPARQARRACSIALANPYPWMERSP